MPWQKKHGIKECYSWAPRGEAKPPGKIENNCHPEQQMQQHCFSNV